MVETAGKKKAIISKPIYLYRSDTPNSLSKRFAQGELDTKRVVYYFRHVTKDMPLMDEFREADKEAEVILMTESLIVIILLLSENTEPIEPLVGPGAVVY